MRNGLCLTFICLMLSTAVVAAAQDAPAITRVMLANGSFNTASTTVPLGLATSGVTPTAFRTSEHADMSGAAWKRFTSSPSVTLSSQPGGKIVFVQVGWSPSINTTTTVTRVVQPIATLPGDLVPAPTKISNIARDTIMLGLPDIRSSVTMPSLVHDKQVFNIDILITNAGQLNPKEEVIEVYNSFVTSHIFVEQVEVAFLGQLTGKGCKITDTSTVECSVAPLPHDGAMAIHLLASAHLTTAAQETHTLRTRITGVRESDTANNWRDTPITIVK
jgi:hypothetical protein